MTTLSELSKGAVLSASAKLLSKGIGLISTLILARLLTPSDFGVIAAISIALYFFDVLGNVATEQYIMQKRRLRLEELETAWSVNVVIKCVIFLVLVGSSSLIANFLNKPEITAGLVVVSFILPLNALKSPSLLQQKRMVRYQGLFALSITEKLVAFVTVIAIAVTLKSYWAFIIADLVSSLSGVVLSYVWFKKRPRFRLSAWRSQVAFSSWMLGKNVVGYLRSQVDTVFVSRYFAADTLGQYHLSRELAMMPGHYFLAPALEPVLSALRHTVSIRDYFYQQVSSAVVITLLISIPIAAFLSVFAEPIALLLLGEQWSMAGHVLSVLAWLVVYWGVVYVLEITLIAQGKLKTLFAFDLFTLFTIMMVLGIALASAADITNVALYRVLTGVATTLLVLLVIYRSHLILAANVFMWALLISAIALLSANLTLLSTQFFTDGNALSILENLLTLSCAGLFFLLIYGVGIFGTLLVLRKTKIAIQVMSIIQSSFER